MPLGQCHITYIVMRAEPSGKSEMVSQLIFGETYRVLEDQGDWLRIETDFDHYQGWISAAQYVSLDEVNKPFKVQNDVSLFFNDRWTSCGSELGRESPTSSESDLLTLAADFMNTPYLWGGRTFMGIDCSGFIQVLFKSQGIALPRDARDQVNKGVEIKFEDRHSLDVAFFANAQGFITHTGLLISTNEIIHAHGWVRTDAFDDKGIFNKDKNRYTHFLHSLRRLL